MKVLNKFLKNGTGNYVEGVVNGRTGSGPVRSTSCETLHDTFKIASWHIGTMRGRSSEIVETITRRNVDLCCVQEVRWRGASARHITGKDSRYKFFWVGNNQGTSGVGVLLAEKWVDKVYDIKRVSDRIMLIKLLVGEAVLTVLSVYAPQTGLEESTKDAFYDSLQTVISELPDKEIVIPCGDWNGHVGREAAGYEGVHGGSGYGERNADGDRVLEFAVANDFVIGNTFFVKKEIVTLSLTNLAMQNPDWLHSFEEAKSENGLRHQGNTKRGMCPTAQTSNLWTSTENTETPSQTMLSKTLLLEAEGTNCTRRVRAGIQVQGECI